MPFPDHFPPSLGRCSPGVMAVIASNPPPVFPGLSVGDTLTVYFTRLTNHPDVVSLTALSSLLTVTPTLATIVRAQWLTGPDEVAHFAEHCPSLLVYFFTAH